MTHKGPSCKIKKGIYKVDSPSAGLFLCIKKLHAKHSVKRRGNEQIL